MHRKVKVNLRSVMSRCADSHVMMQRVTEAGSRILRRLQVVATSLFHCSAILHVHAVKLGVLDETNKDTKGLPLTVRAAYILKPDKTIALIMYYPASTGKTSIGYPYLP